MKRLIIISIFLILSSCTQKQESKPRFLKITYYPTFNQSVEGIVNFTEKYLVVNNPSADIPPPFPFKTDLSEEENERIYMEYKNKNRVLEPFFSNLSNEESEKLEKIISGFKDDDFKDPNIRGIDGTAMVFLIIYSNGKIVQIRPGNSPNQNQKYLSDELMKIIIAKNKSELNKLILER